MDRDDPTLRDLTCRALVDLVMDYLDDLVPPGERRAFEAHLADCEDCLVYLRSYRATIRLGRAYGASDDARAAPMPEDLVRAILAARPPKR